MKIAICVPVHGDTKALFTLCLSRMLLRSAKRLPNIEVIMESGSILPAIRTELVKRAREWGADFILWMDADHTFPPDTLLRLLSHGKPVVACNYPARMSGLPVAALPGLRRLQTTKAKAGQLEEAATAGLGLALVSMKAIDAVKGPLFAYEVKEDGSPSVGEDSWFFHRLREAGYPLLIDHALSLRVGHIAEQVRLFTE